MSRSPTAWRRWLLLILFVLMVLFAASFLIWPNGSFSVGRPGGSVIHVHPKIKEIGT